MQNINVNIVPDNFPQTIRYSQGDIGRQFKINVADFDIPVGATVKIQATKPSGFGFSVAGVVADNSVTFTTTAEMTDEAGRFQAELQITAGDDVIGTANFLMIGERNPHPEGTTDGSQGTIIPELTLLVERVEAAASSVLDMEVVATTLPAGSQATYSYDEDLNKATFGIPEGQAGAGAAGVVASAYSAAKTYKVGDYVLYNSTLYRCTTAITTAEAWTAAHWTQIVLADDVTDLKTDLDDRTEIIEEKIKSLNLLDPSTIQYGKYCNSSNLEISSSSSYNLAIVPVESGKTYTFTYGNRQANDYRFRFCYFADENKQGGFQGINGETYGGYGQFTVPEGATFAYITIYANKMSSTYIPMLVEGDIQSTFFGYIPYYDKWASKIEVKDITDFAETGKNLLDESASVSGYLDLGTISQSTTYKVSDYIPVKADTPYTIYPKARSVMIYGNCKQFITSNRTDGIKQITPSQDGYIRLNYYAIDSGLMQVEEGAEFTGYEKYCSINKHAIYPNADQIAYANTFDHLLNGKKWAVCGDSFTDGATNTKLTSGRYNGKQLTYPYIIGNRTNVEVLKFFQSGKTLAYPTDGSVSNSLTNPSATDYYQNIPIDTDYITIYLGINDGNHNALGEEAEGYIPLGTITDNDTSSYYGAWNVVLSWLIENRPFAHIGIIVSNGCQNSDWVDAQIAIAEKYGIPYIDLNGDKQTPAMIRSQNPKIASTVKTLINQKQAVDYPSNTHPNDDAQLFESTFIEEFLRSI